MTTQQAILIGAGIIGAAILVARIAAPYQISAGGGAIVWRVNTITGAMVVCLSVYSGSALNHKCYED